jgi:hypothetical protein
MATNDRFHEVVSHPRAKTLLVTLAVAFLASACATTRGSSPATAAVQTPSSVTSPTAATLAGQVMGTGHYPGYTVDSLPGWSDLDSHFVVGPPEAGKPRAVLGLSVWDVGQVYSDPCHWHGQGFDPGPSVADLVAALVAQKMRNATTPTDATLAGYEGKYLEWSVPADMKSSTYTDFDACDLAANGVDRDFASWLGNGMGERYEEVPGQVDQLWVLNVNGQRLVVHATYSPDTTQSDRAALEQVVNSLRFSAS